MKPHTHKSILSYFIPGLLSLLWGTFGCSRSTGTGSSGFVLDKEASQLLDSLDRTLRAHPVYVARKEATIDSLRRQLPGAHGPKRFRLLNEIYGQYNSYDLDSAAHYASLKAEAATNIGKKELASEAVMNRAIILIARGKEADALAAMKSVEPDTVHPMVRRLYYDAMEGYSLLENQDPTPWMLRLSQNIDTASSRWVYNESNLWKRRGNLARAMELLDLNDSIIGSTPHKKAITAYLRGSILLQQGDTLSGIKQLARSVTHDLQVPVRDYRSLYALAGALVGTGQDDRAYRLITFAMEDANSTHVLENMRSANELVPAILHAHERETAKHTQRSTQYTIGISALTLILSILLVSVGKSLQIARRAGKREKALNEELASANRHLGQANDELLHLNLELKEHSDVKDAYLMQYFNLCSQYLGRLEQFRSTVSAAARSKGLPGVERAIAEADDDKELREFYSNFDATFLRLFPSFVSRLNELLLPEARLSLRANGQMSNELRTCALLRLGVTDSTQIALFLRRSVSTIYNYRVHLRNSATCPRDEFEVRVATIPK